MKIIYKYELETTDEQIINLPPIHEILCVQVQKGKPCLWALVEPNSMISQEVKIRIYGTGHPIDEEGEYLGTYQLMEGSFIGHVFKVS